MKRHCFVCLFHSSDCCEEVECVVERRALTVNEVGVTTQRLTEEDWYTYQLVSYPTSCKCGRPVPHSDPPQEALRAAWGLPEAEDIP